MEPCQMLHEHPCRKFSRTLFWDTTPEDIDFVRNQKWVVARVLEHGRVEDWEALKQLYPMRDIVASAQQVRSLDAKAFAFIRFLSGKPKESFRCFTEKRSTPAR